ncbi:hypothetical protein AGMMS50267_18020 [Spirochaetia bacterium]|nr:hypothetical protein AGMMS50267_18020 [Spirochaetia bacterium]
MDILFLGTAAAEGIPALFCRCQTCRNAAEAGGPEIRTRCAYLVNGHLLLDLPPDILFHKLRYNLDLAAVDTVCVTHSHTDHLNRADLCFRCVPVYAHIPGEKPLDLYANKKCCDTIRGGLEFEFGSPEHPSLAVHEIGVKSVLQRGELKITALHAKHDPREDCLMFLVQEGEKSFFQANDTALPEDDMEAAMHHVLHDALQGRTLDAVSMDCTHGKEPGSRGHMGITENRIFKQRLVSAGLADENTQFFANHFSHNGHVSHAELCESLAPHGIRPAYDGMVLGL